MTTGSGGTGTLSGMSSASGRRTSGLRAAAEVDPPARDLADAGTAHPTARRARYAAMRSAPRHPHCARAAPRYLGPHRPSRARRLRRAPSQRAWGRTCAVDAGGEGGAVSGASTVACRLTASRATGLGGYLAASGRMRGLRQRGWPRCGGLELG
eukprot:scaffold79944_cov29-Tisochrysis_lutea.AAC.4